MELTGPPTCGSDAALTLQQLLPPKGRVPKPEDARKQIVTPPPLPVDFVDVAVPLTPSSTCHTSLEGRKMRARGTETQLSSGCQAAGGGGLGEQEQEQEQESFSQASQDSLPQPSSVLTSLSSGHGVEPSTIVIGEEMPRCVVVDLQGNMVMQDHHPEVLPTAAAAAGSYLVEEPILVQVSQEQEADPAPLGFQGHAQYIRGKSSVSYDVEGKDSLPRPRGMRHEVKANVKYGNGAKVQNRAEFESRWNFREVMVKTECPPTASEPPPDEDESGGEDSGRPRRKSAKKARLRWKTINDVEAVGKGGSKRARRLHFLSRERGRSRLDTDLQQEGLGGEVELPVWAQRLSSVRVVDSKWVVGVAASSDILQQTLEAHSRSVLCDYIKSHPSSLEQRHRAKCQASRIMWHHQRIKFDGVPFTILSSNDLKCAFGMKYKLKRKETVNGESVQRKGGMEEEEGGGGEGSGTERHHHHHLPATTTTTTTTSTTTTTTASALTGSTKDVLPKKKYKDIWFTSCEARITVKVIVKYPGYAVSAGALSAERKMVMKALRLDMSKGVSLEREELYHVTLPLSCVHNHPLQGRSRGIHPSVDKKIIELLKEGVTTPKVIKQMLDQHVEVTHAGDMVVPHPEDRAYYPRLKDIANLVYTRCKKMGITAKRKVCSDPPTFEAAQRKRRKQKRSKCEGELEADGEGVCVAGGAAGGVPLQASTLQEAVQTFCTEESERGSVGGLEGRDCVASESSGREEVGEAAGLAEMVRGQLDTLRSLTYSQQEYGTLQEVYQALQVLLNQYVVPGPHALPEGLTEVPSTTFILQDTAVDPLSVPTPPQCVPEGSEHLGAPERDGGGTEAVTKTRSAPPLRQLRPPVALQCLTTSMVPTLAVSQLPRASTHAPPPHQPHGHLVTSVPHSSTLPPTTYQTLAPVAQDGPPTPVHLSLPPYFYYVQEVTVPESSQTWTYTTSS